MKNEKATSRLLIPAKLILFGEWAILKGHMAVGCSVGKSFDLELVDHNKTDALFIESQEISFEWTELNQKPPAFLEKTCSILQSLYENPLEILRGKKLILNRNWDLSEGLGSSSALYLGLSLLGPLDQNGGSPLPKNIYERSEVLRQKLVKFQNGGSGFDMLLQALGGFVRAQIKENIGTAQHLKLEIPDEVLFVHTGKKMKTDVALTEFQNKNDVIAEPLKNIARSTEKFFETRDWEKSIHEHSRSLEQMGVVPSFVRDVKAEWIQNKWITQLKTTGAGGGDTLMLFINPCKRPELEADLVQKGFWLEEAPLGVAGALTE